MRRGTVVLLLGGAVASLTSLYLPWQEGSGRSEGGTVSDLLNLFAANRSLDGWSSGVADVEAVAALLLTALAAVALLRPKLADRLPLAVTGVAVAYFMVAVAVLVRSVAQGQEATVPALDYGYAYGTYVGIAAALVVLGAGVVLRRDELALARSASGLVVPVLVLALIVTFLLPWRHITSPAHFTFYGIQTSAAAVAVAFALCVPLVWWAYPSRRLALGLAVALLTAAAASAFTSMGSSAYGAWLGIALAAVLVLLTLRAGVHVSRPAGPAWRAAATGVAGALFVASLFLPWFKACYSTASEFGPLAGRCISANGWTAIDGTVAAVLVSALIVATLAPGRVPVSDAELGAALGLVVATLASRLTEGSGSGLRLERGFGSWIGLLCAACLLGLAAIDLRGRTFVWNRVPARLVPITACVAYLAVVLVTWWSVLPQRLETALRFAPASWLTIAGVLLAVYLLGSWTRQIAGVSSNAELLVLLPVALLALAAVDLVRLREEGFTWGRGAVAGLCLLLLVLGRVEQREGLENVRVPELLRVDRL